MYFISPQKYHTHRSTCLSTCLSIAYLRQLCGTGALLLRGRILAILLCMLTLLDSYEFSAHPNTSTFDWLQGFGNILAAPQNVLLHLVVHMDLLAMSVHFLNFLTLSSPYYVSFESLASGANLFLTMHPRPVTLCVIGALYPIVLHKSPSPGILLGVLCISAPAIALADAVRWSNCTVCSKRRSVGSRIKGSASQDFEWDGLTLHPNNSLSSVTSKASKPKITFGTGRTGT